MHPSLEQKGQWSQWSTSHRLSDVRVNVNDYGWREQINVFHISSCPTYKKLAWIILWFGIMIAHDDVTGEFPTQTPVTWSVDVFFDLRLNWQLSTQWRRWWFEKLPRSLWRHCNACKMPVLMFMGTFPKSNETSGILLMTFPSAP